MRDELDSREQLDWRGVVSAVLFVVNVAIVGLLIVHAGAAVLAAVSGDRPSLLTLCWLGMAFGVTAWMSRWWYGRVKIFRMMARLEAARNRAVAVHSARLRPSPSSMVIGQRQAATHSAPHRLQHKQYGDPPQPQQCAGTYHPDPPQL